MAKPTFAAAPGMPGGTCHIRTTDGRSTCPHMHTSLAAPTCIAHLLPVPQLCISMHRSDINTLQQPGLQPTALDSSLECTPNYTAFLFTKDLNPVTVMQAFNSSAPVHGRPAPVCGGWPAVGHAAAVHLDALDDAHLRAAESQEPHNTFSVPPSKQTPPTAGVRF